MYIRGLVLTALWGVCLSALVYGCALAQQGTREVGFGDDSPALTCTADHGELNAQAFGQDFSVPLSPAAYGFLSPYASYALDALPAPIALTASGLIFLAHEVALIH